MLRRATSGLPQRGQGLPRGSSMTTLLDHHVDRLAQLGPVAVVNPQIASGRIRVHGADNDELTIAFIIDPDRVGALIEKRLPFWDDVYPGCSDLHFPILRIRASIRAFCRARRFMAMPCRISLEVGGMFALARILACSTVERLRSKVCSSACRVMPAASAASSTPMPSISTMRSACVDADAWRIGESKLRSLHSACQCSSFHFIRLHLP